MKNLKRNILLSLAATSTIIAPVATVVSCGSSPADKSQTGEIKKAKVDFNFDSKVHSLVAVKELYDDFYKDEAVKDAENGAEVTISASHGVSLTVDLSAAEWNKVVTAGELPQTIDDNTTLDDFAAIMDAATGATHQYYFDEAIAKKLGADSNVISSVTSLLHIAKPSSSNDSYDEAFAKQWLMDNLIHTLPSSITIEKLNWDQSTNNVIVTFTDGTAHKDVDFHLAKAKTAEEAKTKNEEGANLLNRMITKVEKPFKSIFGSIKEFFILAKSKVTGSDVKKLAEGILADAATSMIVGAAEVIPAVKVIMHTPIVGAKIEDFVNQHLVTPITKKVVDAIV